MKHSCPQRWMERILPSLLANRDRESVAGDLHEEFCARDRAHPGGLRADLWYARQVFSFVPAHLGVTFQRSPVLFLLCGFTASSGLWLGAMGLRLKHPGYVAGEWIAGTIVLQSMLTVSALCFRDASLLRRVALMGTAAVVLLAVKALIATLRGTHLEGYVLLIALGLIVQALLTLQTLPRRGGRRRTI